MVGGRVVGKEGSDAGGGVLVPERDKLPYGAGAGLAYQRMLTGCRVRRRMQHRRRMVPSET